MKTIFKILLLILCLTTEKYSHAQTYDFRNYGLEDGLAQSQILSMCQDKYGNIWFGTNGGGVSKYDGNKFENITENDSLVNNVVYSITELKNGNLLFGTNGGLSIYNGYKFKNFTEKDGLKNNRILKVAEDNNGIVWLGTSKGVYQLINQKIVPFTQDAMLNNSNVWVIFSDKENNIWFGTVEYGAIKYNTNNKTFTNYNLAKGISYTSVKAINEDKQGNIYIGTKGGIRRINKLGKVESVNIPHEENIGFLGMVVDERDNLWLATNEGVIKYNGFTTKRYQEKNGLVGNNVWCVLKDREGNLWFGTIGSGVSKFLGEEFKTYGKKDSLPGEIVTTLFQDSKRNIWLGLQDCGVTKLQKNNITTYSLNPKKRDNSIADNTVRAIEEDNSGRIYFGTKDGLSILDGNTFTNYGTKNGLPSNLIHSIFKDKYDRMWIGTKYGICYFQDKKIIPIDAVNSLRKDQGDFEIFSVFEDTKNNLWLGSENGVIRYNHKTAMRFNKSNGFTDKRVLSVTRDNFGFLWFGTDEGVYYYDYKTFKLIDQNKGLSANKVYIVLVDGNYLWVGTRQGLNRINLMALHRQDKIVIKRYAQDEGFKGVECNANAQMKDNEGNLWFGTIKGATVYNPREEKINNKEAITRITGLELFYKKADDVFKKYSTGLDSATGLPINLVLPYDKNHITFDFIGLCLTNPFNVKYQFKLDGVDDTWNPPTTETNTTYSSLPAGEYTFELKAMNNDELWNRNPISFHFKILPPWWKTWWFYAFSVLLIFASIYFYVVNHTRNLQKAKVLLENEVELRTHELREEKEKVELINEEVIAQKAIIELKNNDITDSIKYAKNIQEALLPPLNNLLNEMNDAFVLYLPKDIVSGDFYWFSKRNNKRFIASVDCTGHGVPGAFMSIVGNTLLGEIVSDKNITKPSEILNELHAGVKSSLKQSNSDNERRDGMDIALCALNEDGSVLEYAGANRPLWIFRKNKSGEEAFEMIKANKFPIGGLEMENEVKRQFTNHEIPLEKGDVIYIFSDGFADQFGGAKGKKFMLGNLQKLVSSIYELPIKEQEKVLYNAFSEWKGNIEQVDDVLIIGFRV